MFAHFVRYPKMGKAFDRRRVDGYLLAQKKRNKSKRHYKGTGYIYLGGLQPMNKKEKQQRKAVLDKIDQEAKYVKWVPIEVYRPRPFLDPWSVVFSIALRIRGKKR